MKSIKKIWPYIKKYWPQILIALLAIGIMSLTDLLVPRQVQTIIDRGIADEDTGIILRSSLWMIGLSVLSMVLAVVNTTLAMRVSEGFAADLREALYTRIQAFSFANLDRLQTSDLLVRLTSDVNIIRTALMMGMRLFFRAPLLLVGSLVLLVMTSPRLALLLLVLLPLTLGLIWLFSSRTSPLFRAVQKRLERVNSVFLENIAGVRLVRAFVRESFEKDRFSRANEALTEKSIQVNSLLAFLMPTMVLVLNLGVAALLWFGGNMVIVGNLTTGQIVAFSNYLFLTMFPLLLMAMILPQYYAAMASVERVMEVLETQPGLAFPALSEARITRGEVLFEDVSLDYDGKAGVEAPVLQDISFTARPGETIAILGATGSGKTSLVNLIARLYDPTEGRVLIDGVDVREFSKAELHRNIAVALQEAVLFSGTVAENIRFGCPDASDEDVVAAARAAQADEFIQSKPEGYQSAVGQRGANFSGGQKQRLAIARALCIQPRILILDDSTSAVDVETEVAIQAALDTLMADRTSFIVAQRISTVLRADRILVLDQGRIVAQGTHRELMGSSPIYRDIYLSQLGNGVEKADSLADVAVDYA